MQPIKREDFLGNLEAVKAGLSAREFVEQSSCFVFQDGWVMTYNDEVACQKEIGIKVEGAVQANALLTILEKIQDDDLTVHQNEDKELEFEGKGKQFGIVMDAEIYLPIDQVEKPKKWYKLPKSFLGALELVQHCVSKDQASFMLTCIHIHPDYIEACDNLQIMRVECLDVVDQPTLVRGASLIQILSIPSRMDQVALTKSWIHFRNPEGLIFSCRRYDDEFPDLNPMLDFEGRPVMIPKGVKDAADRAEVFAVDKSGEPLVHVSLAADRICITGDGLSGWYREMRKIKYDGDRLEFMIAPGLLKYISDSDNFHDARINPKKLKVVGKMAECPWEYATVLGQPRTRETEEPEQEQNEQEERPKTSRRK